MKGKYLICFKIIFILFYNTFPFLAQTYLQIYDIKTVLKNHSQMNVKFNDYTTDSISLTVISRRYLYKKDSIVVIYDSLIDGEFRISSNIVIPMGPSLKMGSVKAHHGVGIYDIKNKKFAFINDSITYSMNLSEVPLFKIKGKNVFLENYKDVIIKLKKSNNQTYYPFLNELFLNYEVEYLKIPNEELKLKYSGKPVIFIDEKKILEIKSLFNKNTNKSNVTFSEFILKTK